MKVEVHILAHNEEEILPFTLRHYATFATRMVVHDADSTDKTTDIALDYGAGVKPWFTDGLNDAMALDLKNSCWLGTDADWVICVDADELIYFPEGAGATLEKYHRIGAAIIRPHGFEMFSPKFPTTRAQIYDEVKQGAPDDKWYGKPVLFSPAKIASTGFGVGAHEARPILHSGRTLKVDQSWPQAKPPTYLLHFNSGIGPVSRVARRYAQKRDRLSRVNVEHRWGNFEDPMKHALDKRAFILSNLCQVIT